MVDFSEILDFDIAERQAILAEAEPKKRTEYETIDFTEEDIRILESIWDDIAEEEAVKRQQGSEAVI